MTNLIITTFECLNTDEYNNEISKIGEDYSDLWIYNIIANKSNKSERTKNVQERVKKICNSLDNLDANFLRDELYNTTNIDMLYEYNSSQNMQTLLLKWLNTSTIGNFLSEHKATEGKLSKGVYRTYINLNNDEHKKVNQIISKIKLDDLNEKTKELIELYKKQDEKIVY